MSLARVPMTVPGAPSSLVWYLIVFPSDGDKEANKNWLTESIKIHRCHWVINSPRTIFAVVLSPEKQPRSAPNSWTVHLWSELSMQLRLSSTELSCEWKLVSHCAQPVWYACCLAFNTAPKSAAAGFIQLLMLMRPSVTNPPSLELKIPPRIKKKRL